MPTLPLALALVPSQAGGGGAFGGGGGGGGGDGAIPIELLFWLIRIAFEYPVIGVPLLIFVCVLFAVGARRGWWKHQERVIHRSRPARVAYAAAQRTARLREHDAAFDEAAFLARVENAFNKAQVAWCAQELEPLRPFVSDGVFERFSLQIAEQREAGWRQGMHALHVERPIVQHVELGRRFETVTLRIAFRADIHRIDLVSGKRIEGSKLPREHFEECWSFVRARGAKSKPGGGLIEGQCPNCGATLAMTQSAKCASCSALVRSGEFDWVLTEITQASEWRPEDEAAAPGLDEYGRRDPGISAQLLEDRVSVAFWRWSDAERLRKADPLARVASEEFCAREAARFAAVKPDAPRLWLGDRAVGSVRTAGVVAGDDVDRALVEVTWDGRFARVAKDGKVAYDEHRTLRRTLFVLSRKAGERSSTDDSFSSARCPSCGAHDAGGVDPLCPYCAAPRTGGRSVWLVSEVFDRGDRAYAERMQQVRSARAPSSATASAPAASRSAAPSSTIGAQSPSGLLAWTVAAARSDGQIDARERIGIEALARQTGAAPERVAALLTAPLDQLPSPRPSSPAEARAWLEQLCELALADGAISSPEQAFLRHAARNFDVAQDELTDAYDTVRARLYRESKRAMSERSAQA